MLTRLIRASLLATASFAMITPPAQATIAFEQLRGDTPTLFVADDDGSDRRKVATGTRPALSPDGRYLAHISPNGLAVKLTNLRTGRTVTKAALGDTRLFAGPLVWSEDGRRIVTEQYRLHAHGRVLSIDVASGDFAPIAPARALAGWPIASPDGRTVMRTLVNGDQRDLHVTPADGSAPERRFSDDGDILRADWSRSGLIVERPAADGDGTAVWLMQGTSGELIQHVAGTTARPAHMLRWTQGRIAWLEESADGRTAQVKLRHPDGSTTGSARFPMPAVDQGLSLTADGRHLVTPRGRRLVSRDLSTGQTAIVARAYHAYSVR